MVNGWKMVFLSAFPQFAYSPRAAYLNTLNLYR
jgi:hypothetical protein